MHRPLYWLLFFAALTGNFACSVKTTPGTTSIETIVWTSVWSPDGKYIAAGGNQGFLRIYHANNLKVWKEYPVAQTITKLRWHPGSKVLLASLQTSKEVSFYINIETDIRTPVSGLPETGTRGAGWSHDGQQFAFGDSEGNFHVYNFFSQEPRTYATMQKSITGLSWNPKNDLIAVIGSHIEIHDHRQDTAVMIIPRPKEVLLLGVAWHPSGKYFVTSDYGIQEEGIAPLLQFWSPDGRPIKSVEHAKYEYRNIAWSPDGEYLASASESLCIWDKQGELLFEGKAPNLLWGVDWSPDQQKIITSTEAGDLILWNTKAEMLKRKKF